MVNSADVFPDKCCRLCQYVDFNAPFSDAFTELFEAICCFEVLEHLENLRPGIGYITLISDWQMRKMLDKNNLEVVEQVDYDGSAALPQTVRDLLKIMVRLLRPVLAGC
jgi:hypothetical protein